MTTIGKLAWHVHHENKLFEMLTEPLEARRNYINHEKPPHEIETRQRLLQVIEGPLPFPVEKATAHLDKAAIELDKAAAEFLKASNRQDNARAYLIERNQDEWSRANDEWNKAEAEWQKAGDEWVKACHEWQRICNLPENVEAMAILHAKECPNCPWDGKTIFPKG